MSQDSKGSPPLTLNLNLTINIPRDTFKQGETAQQPHSLTLQSTSRSDQKAAPQVGDFEQRAKGALEFAKGDKPNDARGLLAREFRKVKGELPQAKHPSHGVSKDKEQSR